MNEKNSDAPNSPGASALREQLTRYLHETRGSGVDFIEIERFIDWIELRDKQVSAVSTDEAIESRATHDPLPIEQPAPGECGRWLPGELLVTGEVRLPSGQIISEPANITAGADMLRGALEAPINTELKELRELRREVEHFLALCPFTIRCREGGGPENVAKSFVMTFMKIDDEMTKLRERLEPGDFTELLKRLPYVSEEFANEIAIERVAQLQRRVLIQKDWLGSHSCALDNLDLTINGRPIGGAGIDKCRMPRDIRLVVERLIDALQQKNKALDDVRNQLIDVTVEKERLHMLINSPQIADFIEAIKLEAIHQRERWGSDHDAGKSDVDWLFLAGYLGGKAVEAGKMVDMMASSEHEFDPDPTKQHRERRLHHIVAAGAAVLNWHAQRIGIEISATRMRPGIFPPPPGESPVETIRRGLMTVEEAKRAAGDGA